MQFRLEDDAVIQTEHDGTETTFDPKDWGVFTRGSLAVHAVRIPRPFKVGAETCKDGHLVFDGSRIYAVSEPTFERTYSALDRRARRREAAARARAEREAA